MNSCCFPLLTGACLLLASCATRETDRDFFFIKTDAMNAMASSLPRYLGMEDSFAPAPIFLMACATLAVLTGGIYFINRSGLLGATLLTGSVQSPDGQSINVTEITPGTIYQLSPGQIIPTASRLLSGEADPRHLTDGGWLPSGSLHTGCTPLTLESLETWDTSLYRRLHDTRETEVRHPWLDRILRYYILTVLTLALLGGLAWWIHSGHAATGLQVMTSLLVVTCPCALGVALPLADDLAAAAMERSGVFIRRPAVWPRLPKVRHILFDNTGTLTLESPTLDNPEILQHLDPECLTALKTLIHDSLHPVSRSLTEALAREHGPLAREFPKAARDPRDQTDPSGQKDPTPPPTLASIPNIKEIPGCGLSLTDASHQTWTLGHPTWDGISQKHLTLPAAPWSNHPADAVFRHHGTLLAKFRFKDTLRPETHDTLAVLQRQGYTLHILSSDRSEKAAHPADQDGIPRAWCVLGNLSPAEQASAVRNLDQHNTLYLGDGVNDSLAFDEAFCTGTPFVDKGVLENRADFYFPGRSLGFISTLFATAHQRQRAVRHTAAFALLYNASAGLLCLAGLMNPLLAAILTSLSSVVTLAIVALHFRRRA